MWAGPRPKDAAFARVEPPQRRHSLALASLGVEAGSALRKFAPESSSTLQADLFENRVRFSCGGALSLVFFHGRMGQRSPTLHTRRQAHARLAQGRAPLVNPFRSLTPGASSDKHPNIRTSHPLAPALECSDVRLVGARSARTRPRIALPCSRAARNRLA
jgi:hypothetical protein